MAQKQTKSTDVIEVVADRDKPCPPKAESIDFIKDAIYTIRGMKVMLDADLAEIYGYQTSRFNQQVKNNIEKFDADFRFQITKEEYLQILSSKITIKSSNTNNNANETDLKSKILTSSWGGNRKLPYVFTEQGVYMLMTVLKGELATQQSKALVRAFKALKDFVVDNTSLIGQHEYPLIQFDFRKTCGVYHDRYIVIDYGRKTEKIYHCGASSKDAGKKVTTITQVTDRQVYHPLVDALLLNPVLLLN